MEFLTIQKKKKRKEEMGHSENGTWDLLHPKQDQTTKPNGKLLMLFASLILNFILDLDNKILKPYFYSLDWMKHFYACYWYWVLDLWSVMLLSFVHLMPMSSSLFVSFIIRFSVWVGLWFLCSKSNIKWNHMCC